MPDSGLI